LNTAQSVQAAPAALANGAAAIGSTLPLINGALKIMAWTKAKAAIVGSAVVLLAAGKAKITINDIEGYQSYPRRVQDSDSSLLAQVPPLLKVLPTKFPNRSNTFGISSQLPPKILCLNWPLAGTPSAVAVHSTDFVRPTELYHGRLQVPLS
jgi:hypothetical protein